MSLSVFVTSNTYSTQAWRVVGKLKSTQKWLQRCRDHFDVLGHNNDS